MYICVVFMLRLYIAADGPAASTSSTTSTADELGGLEQMRKQKQFKLVIETGKQKFNMSPRKV